MSHLDPFDRVRAEELIRGYDARWGAEVVETIRVEAEFTTPLVNPETGAESRTWQLAGKLDVIARVDGRLVYVEHKTSSEDIGPGSPYYARLRLDGQASNYFVGARALGYDVEAAIYDVLGKPGIKPLRATPVESRKYVAKTGALYANQRAEDETVDEFRARFRETLATDPERFYQRVEVVRLDKERDDAAFDMWATGQQIRESQRLKRWPRNPGACSRWGRMCGFFDACTGAAGLDDTTRFRQVESAHEELAVAAASSPRRLPLLTSSSSAAYRTCPRLYELRYERGLKPAVEADPLRFGSLVHVGLETWWLALDGDRLAYALEAIRRATEETQSAAA